MNIKPGLKFKKKQIILTKKFQAWLNKLNFK